VSAPPESSAATGRPDAAPRPTGVADGGSVDRLRIDRGAAGAARSRRRSRTLWIVVVLVLLAGGGAGFALRDRFTSVEVRVAKVRRLVATEGAVSTTASGYVVARTRAAISSRLSGRLEVLNVDVDADVKAGDVLAELGHADLDAALAQAEATTAMRRSDVEAAKARRAVSAAALESVRSRVREADAAVREMETRLAEADRVVALQERLAKSGAGVADTLEAAKADRAATAEMLGRSKAAADSARADLARADADLKASEASVGSAEAAVAVAEAATAQARALRQDAFIVAPFSGRVVRKEAEVGEMVAPVNAAGSTTRGAVVTLVDFATLEMEVDVIERDISKVEDGAPCRIVLDARRDHPYAGVVRQLVPTADRSTSTVRVKVSFRDLDDFVRPEMGGRVEFLKKDRADAALTRDRVLVDASAFVEREGTKGVWVVREGAAQWQPARPVDGAASSGEVEVAEGLAGGEDVVLSPAASLAPGALVSVKPAPQR